MSQNKLLYTGLTSTQYFNLARDLSWMNSKNHEHSDRDGHVLGYICNIKIHGEVANTISLVTAPNTWKMRNSFRKWHAYRELMFSEAGVTESEQGRYGKTIRPYLDAGMKAGTIKDPVGWDLSAQTQEWSYTQIAAAPGFDASGTGTDGKEIVDVYDLNLTGVNQVEHTASNGTQYFTAVGMIHSYNQDRMEVVTPTVDSQTVEGQNNPLALLKQGGSVSGGEVMDIVQDQELEKPPYDITDNGFSTAIVVSDFTQLNPGYDGTSSIPVIKTLQCFVPAGLLAITATATDAAAGILIDVLGIVRCKDMA
jgi:hypothetical protein